MGNQFVQFVDTNVNKTQYLSNELRIMEIFHTVQGEAPFAGYPCVFLRLSGCNRGRKIGMHCEFCDTFFAYEDGTSIPNERTVETLKEELKDYAQPMLVVTGGEPFLQYPALDNLMLELRRIYPNILIQFETNGDIEPIGLRSSSNIRNIHLVISPKGPPRSNMWYLSSYYEGIPMTLRRVVSSTIPAYRVLLPEWLTTLNFQNVFLSPITVYKQNEEGKVVVDVEASQENGRYCMQLIKANHYKPKMSFQSHVYMNIK